MGLCHMEISNLPISNKKLCNRSSLSEFKSILAPGFIVYTFPFRDHLPKNLLNLVIGLFISYGDVITSEFSVPCKI